MMNHIAPRFAHEFDALRLVAAHLHAQRVKAWPALIGAGRMLAADADWQLDASAAIAADWACTEHWDEPATGGPPRATRAATLAAALDRARATASRTGRDDDGDYADCIAALLWWESRGGSSIAALVRLNRAFRDELALKRAA